MNINIRISPNGTISISGIPAYMRVISEPPPQLEPIDGVYSAGDKRLVAFCEGTWFQLTRSDGAADVFVLGAPPVLEGLRIVSDQELPQHVSRLFELAGSLSARGTVVWYQDNDVYYRTERGRGFRLLADGVFRLEAREVPVGARGFLTADPLVEEMIDALDEIDAMIDPEQHLPSYDAPYEGSTAAAERTVTITPPTPAPAASDLSITLTDAGDAAEENAE